MSGGIGRIGDVLRIQLTNWRWSWPSMVLTGMITPIMTLLALGTVSSGDTVSARPHIFAGALTLALLFEMQNKIAANFSFMKDTGAFEFFSSLPLRREALIGGTLAAFLLLAVPALVVTSVVGLLVFGIGFTPHYLAVIPVGCAVAAFAGIGAIIGSRSTSINQASGLSLAATVLLSSIGPVVIPPDRLPGWLRAAGQYNPAALASDAIRTLFTGASTYGPWWDLAGLGVFTLAVYLVVRRVMPWRGRPA
jgi:ABC-2 type transport system permease protein